MSQQLFEMSALEASQREAEASGRELQRLPTQLERAMAQMNDVFFGEAKERAVALECNPQAAQEEKERLDDAPHEQKQQSCKDEESGAREEGTRAPVDLRMATGGTSSAVVSSSAIAGQRSLGCSRAGPRTWSRTASTAPPDASGTGPRKPCWTRCGACSQRRTGTTQKHRIGRLL